MRNLHRAVPLRQLALTLVVTLIAGVGAACGGRHAGPAAPGAPSLEAAALPYAIVDGRSGRAVAEADFWSALGGARAVCVGEDHPNPHHHWAQLRVVDELVRAGGLGLGLEMVQRPFQGVLDDWAQGRIDDATFLSRSGWAERWGYDFGLYRPMLRRVADAGGPVLALNAPRELTKKVSRQGVASLSAAEKAELPTLVLDDARHRAWFDGVMAAMGGAHGHGTKGEQGKKHGEGGGETDEKADAEATAMAERIYSVQVLWDETMADVAARWLGGGADRRLVILAGNGHCHDSAIVGRLRRRGVERVLSVRPILDGPDVAAAVAEPINDYLLVMTAPD
jgi:uncharacterized iron-regulated protein